MAAAAAALCDGDARGVQASVKKIELEIQSVNAQIARMQPKPSPAAAVQLGKDN